MIFNESKVTEMSAYFLHKRGGCMSYLKLMKLLYLADRESLDRFSMPISNDQMVSMPHGPVLSSTLDLIGNGSFAANSKWSSWIKGMPNYEVALAQCFVPDRDIDELSEADIEVLDSVWDSFGHMTRFQLRDYTHSQCSEWSDPNGSSFPISPKAVFLALGRSPDVAEKNALLLSSRFQLDHFIASMC